MLLLLHKTLKGGRNIQGFALIRAVLYSFYILQFCIVSFFWEEITPSTNLKTNYGPDKFVYRCQSLTVPIAPYNWISNF